MQSNNEYFVNYFNLLPWRYRIYKRKLAKIIIEILIIIIYLIMVIYNLQLQQNIYQQTQIKLTLTNNNLKQQITDYQQQINLSQKQLLLINKIYDDQVSLSTINNSFIQIVSMLENFPIQHGYLTNLEQNIMPISTKYELIKNILKIDGIILTKDGFKNINNYLKPTLQNIFKINNNKKLQLQINKKEQQFNYQFLERF